MEEFYSIYGKRKIRLVSEIKGILGHLTTTRDFESAHLDQIEQAVRRVSDVIGVVINEDDDVAKSGPSSSNDAKKNEKPVKMESDEIDSSSDNGDDEYEVERIIDDRIENDEKHFLVRWKNFDA